MSCSIKKEIKRVCTILIENSVGDPLNFFIPGGPPSSRPRQLHRTRQSGSVRRQRRHRRALHPISSRIVCSPFDGRLLHRNETRGHRPFKFIIHMRRHRHERPKVWVHHDPDRQLRIGRHWRRLVLLPHQIAVYIPGWVLQREGDTPDAP